jgi:ATP-dependent protease ClpP protease subunit
MPQKLNSSGSGHASSLVSSGKIKDSSSWSAPSASEENSYIEKHGISEFGKWYLGIDPEQDSDNKGHYSFPFTSDFEKVDLSGLKACITRAAQSGYTDIESKAKSLYEKAKKKLGKEDDSKDSKPWLVVRNVRNETTGEEATEMVISGTIGSSWYDQSGNTSKEFRDKFSVIPKGRKVNVRVNSEGGSVSDALEIYNLMQSRKDDVTAYNDGYALSSASIIMCGAGRSVTPASSIMMAHEPWSMTVGNEADHLRSAEMLSKHGDTIAQIYARKTGKPADEMREMMKKESWFTGAEACAFGLSDVMADESECPDCGHEQCGDCDTDEDGNITCSECGETNPAHEWDSDDDEQNESEEVVEDRRRAFASLDISNFRRVPQHILNMLRISAEPKPISHALAKGRDAVKPPNDKMNKTAILALLKKHSIEIADNASDEEILAALSKLGEKPAAANGDSDTIAALKKQLQDEKRVRVTNEIKRRGENRIKNETVKTWVDRAMVDGQEESIYAEIEGLNVNRPGGEPIGGQISIVENRLDEIKKISGARNAGKRFKMLRDEWDGIMADALRRDERMGLTQMLPIVKDGQSGGMRAYPVNANTYSSSLVTQFLLDGAVTKLQNRWAPLRVFTRDYSTDRYKPRATGQLKFVTAGGSSQTNASNFESGDSTVTNVAISVSQYTQAFHVSNDELNSGLRMENLVDVNVAAMADTILFNAFSPLNTTDFNTPSGLAVIIRPPASFAWSDMSTAWGEVKKSPIKYAVLDGEYLARLVNQPSFYQRTGDGSTGEDAGWKSFGWDGIYLNTNWTGTHAGAGDQNIRGLICNPQALGAIAGLPLTPPTIPGNTLMESSITVPEVDITIATYQWFSLATRTFWMSYDLMFGSAKLDVTAGVLITSA